VEIAEQNRSTRGRTSAGPLCVFRTERSKADVLDSSRLLQARRTGDAAALRLSGLDG